MPQQSAWCDAALRRQTAALTLPPKPPPGGCEEQAGPCDLRFEYDWAHEQLAHGQYAQAAERFHRITDLAQLGYERWDEDWYVPRCDAGTLFYALAAYHAALIHIDHATDAQRARHERAGFEDLCAAVRARPDLVQRLSHQSKL
ncbi:MAG TPA: hypothetical protein VHM19_23455, partial [Polyangiales bacterium]|nr:hypothetical protein [Polyangiales bacterium]